MGSLPPSDAHAQVHPSVPAAESADDEAILSRNRPPALRRLKPTNCCVHPNACLPLATDRRKLGSQRGNSTRSGPMSPGRKPIGQGIRGSAWVRAPRYHECLSENSIPIRRPARAAPTDPRCKCCVYARHAIFRLLRPPKVRNLGSSPGREGEAPFGGGLIGCILPHGA